MESINILSDKPICEGLSIDDPHFKAFDNAFYSFLGYHLYMPNRHIYLDSPELIRAFIHSITSINQNYNKTDPSSDNFIETIKEDMLIKVFVLNNCVIRICDSAIYEKSYSKVFDFVMDADHPNLECVYTVENIGKYTIIVSKKLIPVLTYNTTTRTIDINRIVNLDDLYNQMSELICYLRSFKCSHGDLRLDNIGFDPQTGNYVAFDFDKFSFDTDLSDRSTLITSIQFKY
jgi:hypothetical protein